jgi:hypothetical protein
MRCEASELRDYNTVPPATSASHQELTFHLDQPNGRLGLKCQFIEDQAATERLRSRVPVRNGSYVRDAARIIFTMRHYKKIGRPGAQARVGNSTKEQRQEWHGVRQSHGGERQPIKRRQDYKRAVKRAK